jgi:hypothetical protein
MLRCWRITKKEQSGRKESDVDGDQWFALFQEKARSRLKEILERDIEATPQRFNDKLEQLRKAEQDLLGR